MFLRLPFLCLVRRELISTMRRGRVFLFVAAMIAATIAFTIYSWPHEDMVFSMAASYSNLFLMMGVQFLSFVCMLCVPGFAANSITTERRQETAELLQLTLIRPGGVILAKLCSSLAFFVMLVIGVMPVFSVLFFLVGMDWATLEKALLGSLITAIACGLIGIHTSARSRRGAHVIVYTYGKIVLLILVLPMLINLGFWRYWGMVSFLNSGVIVSWGNLSVSFVYLTGLVVFLFVSSVHAWQQPIRPARGEDAKSIADRQVLRRRRWSYPFYIVDPLKQKKPIRDGQNPMMIKDIRWGLSGNGSTWARWFVWALLFSLLISLGGLYVDSRDARTTFVVLWFQLLMTVFFVPGLLASAFTKELESGGLDMLRLTLLRPSELIIGKFLGGAMFLVPIVLSWVVLSSGITVFTGPRHIGVKIVGYTTIILCALLCLASSLLASLLARRTGSATMLSYVFAFLLFTGFNWGAGVVLSSLGLWQMDQIRGFVRYLSPISAFEAYAHSAVVGPWATAMTLYGGVCAVLVGMSIQVFKRMYQRDV